MPLPHVCLHESDGSGTGREAGHRTVERRLPSQEEMELLRPLSCRAEALGTAPLRVSEYLASGTRGPPATDARLTPHALGGGFLARMYICKVIEQPGP